MKDSEGQRGLAEDHVGRFFGDHHDRRSRVPRRDRRHDRRVRDAQALHTDDPQLTVDDAIRGRGRPHTAGSIRVPGRSAVSAGELNQGLTHKSVI